MPVPTVTLRPLKNRSSGLDLNIVSVSEKVGILTTVVEYNVVIVTNLQYFKLPQHKDSDVVQFAITKTYEDFEKLRHTLVLGLPHTMFPQLPRSFISSLFETDAAAKRTAVEEFVKCIAGEPCIATNHVVLEFLGVNPVTAGKFTAGKSGRLQEGDAWNSPVSANTKNAAAAELFEEAATSDSDNFFGFPAEDSDRPEENLFQWNPDPAVFEGLLAKPRRSGHEMHLFDDPNLDAEGVGGDEAKVFLVPGAAIEKRLNLDTEDVSDLLTVDDDFEKLLKMTSAPKPSRVTPSKASTSSTSSDIRHQPSSSPPSSTASSSQPRPTPKPKPQIPPKSSSTGASSSSKPVLSPKPPITRAKPSLSGQQSGEKSTGGKAKIPAQKSTELNISDIAKYIHENAQNDEEEDLFS